MSLATIRHSTLVLAAGVLVDVNGFEKRGKGWGGNNEEILYRGTAFPGRYEGGKYYY
jgi:hypothetical protein